MKHVIIALLLMAFAGIAQAQTSTPRIDKRQQNQRERIRQGAVRGELTRKETAHAVGDQRHIKRMERRAKADGTVTHTHSSRTEPCKPLATPEQARCTGKAACLVKTIDIGLGLYAKKLPEQAASFIFDQVKV
jgi:hypothetical protein